MLDFGHFPSEEGNRLQTFLGDASASAVGWQVWKKPQGCTMAQILLVGNGGNGGTGVIGAASTAAGGGGGGSGGISKLTIPLTLLPNLLYLNLRSTGGAVASTICIYPSVTTNHVLLSASGGAAGGNASGATAGAAGTAGAIATIAQCPLSGLGNVTFLAGQAGIIGGTTVSGAALTVPTTGLIVTGGAGGGGLPAGGATGTNGGSFTVPAQPSPFPAHAGGVGGSAATTPPTEGRHGPYNFGFQFGYGGTGGGSTHGSATGAGLVQAAGGNGAPGCGGGGMGGAKTGSTPAVASLGGTSYCIIVCW